MDFHQNWHRRENPKKTSSLTVNITPPFPHFAPKTAHYRQRGPQNTLIKL